MVIPSLFKYKPYQIYLLSHPSVLPHIPTWNKSVVKQPSNDYQDAFTGFTKPLVSTVD